MAPFAAALQGAREVGFTVLSMSLSLIAVFIPILLMGGIVGRLFREFAITLSVAILISLVDVADDDADDVRAAAAPEGGARSPDAHRRLERARVRRAASAATGSSLAWALRHGAARHARAARHDLPQRLSLRDHSRRASSRSRTPGACTGGIQADQSISFQAMRVKLADFMAIVRRRSGGRERRRLHRRRRSAIRASCSSR